MAQQAEDPVLSLWQRKFKNFHMWQMKQKKKKKRKKKNGRKSKKLATQPSRNSLLF